MHVLEKNIGSICILHSNMPLPKFLNDISENQALVTFEIFNLSLSVITQRMSIYSYTFKNDTFKSVIFTYIHRNDYLDHFDIFGENFDFDTFKNDTFENDTL